MAVLNSLIMEDKTIFVYKKHHGHPWVDFDCFLLGKPCQNSPTASYRQRGWGFISLSKY